MRNKTDTHPASFSKGEILANVITHGIGVCLSIAGIVFLIIRAINQGTKWHLIGFIVFGISLLLLYLASTIYHCFTRQPLKALLRIFDHAAIFFLIAGTYTPFLLIKLRNGLGWSFFAIIWALSIIGLIINLVFKSRFEKPPVFLYLAISWLGVIVFYQVISKIGMLSISLLLSGGIFYTSGIIFYRWRKLPYNHAIWHMFVLCGSILHYFSILQLT